jgi:hypothetical protein
MMCVAAMDIQEIDHRLFDPGSPDTSASRLASTCWTRYSNIRGGTHGPSSIAYAYCVCCQLQWR